VCRYRIFGGLSAIGESARMTLKFVKAEVARLTCLEMMKMDRVSLARA